MRRAAHSTAVAATPVPKRTSATSGPGMRRATSLASRAITADSVDDTISRSGAVAGSHAPGEPAPVERELVCLAVMSEGEAPDKDQARAEPAQAQLSLREGEVAPRRKTLAEILEALPAAPGVYIMKDHR